MPESASAGDGGISGVWDVWLHPFRTFRLLRQLLEQRSGLEDQVASLENDRTSAGECLKEQRLENARLSAENVTLAGKLSRSDESVIYLGKEIVRLRAELQEYDGIDRQIEEFQLQLKKVEELKAGYEQRIKRLKTSLHDAREALHEMAAREDGGAGAEVIDMASDEVPAAAAPDVEGTVDGDDGDWLSPLPQF